MELLFSSCNTFYGNCEFIFGEKQFKFIGIPILLFMLDLFDDINCLILKIKNEYELSYPPNKDHIYISNEDEILQFKVYNNDIEKFKTECHILDIYREVYDAISRLIYVLYDNKPDLAELKILQGQSHFAVIRNKWIRENQP